MQKKEGVDVLIESGTVSRQGVFCRCIDCQEIISNPVCSTCLSQQMKVMISEINPKLADEIVSCDVEGETRCLSCGNKMGLCAHCYSKDVYEQLLEKDQAVADEFLSRFDFELRTSLL